MKAAIPTDDGLRISNSFEQAKGFLIFDVESGHLKDIELVWNKNKFSDSEDTFLNPLTGCKIAFAHEFDENLRKVLQMKGINPVSSPDDIITNLIVHYLESEIHQESDYCCCP